MRRQDGGQGTTEYVGVLAVGALIVAAVALASVPQGVATAMERQVCRVVGETGCPNPPQQVAVAPEASRWQLAAAAAEHPDGGSDGWQQCPDDHLCVYAGYGYEEEIYRRQPIIDGDVLVLPNDVEDRIGSWVNNSPYDLCAQIQYGRGSGGEAPMAGDTHPDGRNRDPVGLTGSTVDHIGNCDRAVVEPEPLIPPEEGGPDCPKNHVCLYDDPDFGNEIARIHVEDEDRVDLPQSARDRTSSWVNNSGHGLCARNRRILQLDDSTPLYRVVLDPWSDPNDPSSYPAPAQRRALPPDLDNRFDHIDACP